MIKQDNISKILIIASIMVTIYLSTFDTSPLMLFPAVLLLGGLSMEFLLEKKREEVDDGFELKSLQNTAYYTVLALFGVFMSGYVAKYFPLQLTGFDALLYAMLIAVAEEQFFRGFITDWLLTKTGNPIFGLLASSLVFAVYHLARYGTEPSALIYVLAGGFVLNYVAYKSQRLSSCMLAHIINNCLAVMGVMG